ncbi:MAG: hypothetical protein SGI90_07700 [Candidatus Eisenbacteria bacterium]|nr:hypothetical protein [Candidatus Eisenbacteria bacterium]
MLGLALAFQSCGSGSTTPGPPPDCTSVADTSLPASVTYAADIAPLIDRYSCNTAGCHSRLGTRSRYLTGTHADLFEAGEEATALRICAIKPGLPDSSYLFWKLEGRGGIRGDRMPDNRASLTPGDLELVRTWIIEGAR